MQQKSMRRMSQPGATYRKPGAPVKGLPKMNLPTVGRRTKMMPSAAKVKPIKPIQPIAPPKR